MNDCARRGSPARTVTADRARRSSGPDDDLAAPRPSRRAGRRGWSVGPVAVNVQRWAPAPPILVAPTSASPRVDPHVQRRWREDATVLFVQLLGAAAGWRSAARVAFSGVVGGCAGPRRSPSSHRRPSPLMSPCWRWISSRIAGEVRSARAGSACRGSSLLGQLRVAGDVDGRAPRPRRSSSPAWWRWGSCSRRRCTASGIELPGQLALELLEQLQALARLLEILAGAVVSSVRSCAPARW